ncbi:MAG: hypothetical protein JJU36_00605 [Phycisphaeraceae bacterium]|nr:hypothetical protein [Phycisphaeraceae bacterium]
MQPTQLRPMTVVEILDASFKLYFRHLGSFVLISLMIMIPIILIGLPATIVSQQQQAAIDPDPLQLGLSLMFGAVLGLAGNQLLVGTLTVYISMIYLGKEISGFNAALLALRRLIAMLLLVIVAGLVIGVGFLLLIVPGIILALWLYVSLPALIVEKKGPLAAMSRSRELISGNMARTMGLALLVILIQIAIGMFAGIPVLLTFFTQFPQLAGSILSELIAALVTPVVTIPVVLYYYLKLTDFTPP